MQRWNGDEWRSVERAHLSVRNPLSSFA